MEKMKRFSLYNLDAALEKMRKSFIKDEITIASFSSSNNFALQLFSKTGLDKNILNSCDLGLYDSIHLTNRGLYTLICDKSGQYVTHILIRYANLNSINLEIRPDLISLSLETINNYIYTGEIYGDISDEAKKELTQHNITITYSKISSFLGRSESAINNIINKIPRKTSKNRIDN